MNKLNVNELKFVAYLRKSTDREDKQIQSLETQLREIKRLSELQKFSIVEVISESASAKTPQTRKKFNEMLSSIESGKYNAIVTVSPDRLSRNAVDAGFLAELMTKEKIKIVVTTGMDYEANTMGIMFLQFFMMNAKMENMNKADKVKEGLEGKILKGWLPAIAPQGYLNTRWPEKGHNKIVRDPTRFVLVRNMWDMLLTGAYTVPEIVEVANNQWGYRTFKRKKSGNKPLSKSCLYEIFTNPFYYGYFNYKGELHNGSHEAMVTKKEYDLAQQLLGRTSGRRPKQHVSIYTGLIRCSICGCAITATHKEKYYPKTDNRVVYDYYHCTKRNKKIDCTQPYIKEADLEEQIIEIVSSIEIPEEFKEWASKYLIEKANYEAGNAIHILGSQQTEYNNIERNLSDLLSLRVQQEITSEEYAEKKKVLIEKRDSLKELLDYSESTRDTFKAQIIETFDFAHSARMKFEQGTIEEKREILSKLGQNLLLDDGKLTIDLKKSFLVFKKSKDTSYARDKRLEPVDIKAVTTKYGVSEPQNPLWLPRVDSNHRP